MFPLSVHYFAPLTGKTNFLTRNNTFCYINWFGWKQTNKQILFKHSNLSFHLLPICFLYWSTGVLAVEASFLPIVFNPKITVSIRKKKKFLNKLLRK